MHIIVSILERERERERERPITSLNTCEDKRDKNIIISFMCWMLEFDSNVSCALVIIVENIQYSNQTDCDLIKNHRQSPLLKTATTHLLFFVFNGSIKAGGTRERIRWQAWHSTFMASVYHRQSLVIFYSLIDSSQSPWPLGNRRGPGQGMWGLQDINKSWNVMYDSWQPHGSSPHYLLLP